ncbi:hypothetical protein AAC387_Pa07g2333 [Persea americana]
MIVFKTSIMPPKSARWAEHQPGFDWSEPSFCAVLEILAENDLMRPAFSVAERAVSLNLLGVVDVLMDECISPDVLVKLLDLVLWIYTKKSMVELALSTFYKMGRNGFLPDVNNCNRVFRVLRDGDLLVKTREGDIKEAFGLFDNLGRNHLSPAVVTYNMLINGLCRVGALEEARKLKDEISEHGLLPDVVTYTTLANGSCRNGDLVLAKGFFNEMLGKGFQPDCFTYTARIVGEL